MKRRGSEEYQDMISRLFPELHQGNETSLLTRVVTFMVTDSCNLCCSYCYETHKGKARMSLETAKKFIDLLLSGEKGFHDYINPINSPALVVEFIGGEPLLEIDLIEQITQYLKQRLLELDHPWATKYILSICSNGVLYFEPKVQRYLQKNQNHLSFSVTLDGDRELHDACRVFEDGKGSYDLAVAAVRDWQKKGHFMGSKITIAPANVQHLQQAIRHMVSLGFEEIQANCVYEAGWERSHATELYRQMKQIAKEWIEQDLEETHYLALFEEDMFHPKKEDDVQTWCGGTGDMLACSPDGRLFPCIRYIKTSLGEEREELPIGDVDTGLGIRKEHQDCIHCLKQVDRKTQSTEQCFYCPIAEGCAYCSAYNYQVFGTADSRATYICEMHQARSLANAYFWNRVYRKRKENKRFVVHCPEEWACNIIGKEEYNRLLDLAKED